jgi:hypothetical protein
VTATLVHFEVPDSFLEPVSTTEASPVKGGDVQVTTSTTSREQDSALFASLRASLPAELANRVVFQTVHSTDPAKDVVARASTEVGQSPRNAGDLIVLGRNVGRKGFGSDSHADEIRQIGSGPSGTLGSLAEAVWMAKMAASVLVVKAGLS